MAEARDMAAQSLENSREIRTYAANCLSARALVYSLLGRLTGTHPSAEFLASIPLDLHRTLLPLVPQLGEVLSAVAHCPHAPARPMTPHARPKDRAPPAHPPPGVSCLSFEGSSKPR